MSRKLLSVIVPSYNMEGFLRRGVESLMVDTPLRERLDVIIVNDGSMDRTSEIGHQLAQTYKGVVRIIDKANGNYGSCVNCGLAEAVGSYVRILDADDTYDRVVFAEFLAFLEKQEESDQPVDLVINDYDKVSAEDIVLSHQSYALPSYQILDVRTILDEASAICLPGMTYLRGIFEQISYRQTEGISYTDNEFVIFPMAGVRRLIYFPRVVYRYLIGRVGQSVSALANPRTISMYEILFTSIVDRYNKCNEMPEANREFQKRYITHLLQFVYSIFLFEFPIRGLAECFSRWERCVRAFPLCFLERLQKRSCERNGRIDLLCCARWLAFYPTLLITYVVTLRMAIGLRKQLLRLCRK